MERDIKSEILVCPSCNFREKISIWDSAEWVKEGCPDCDSYDFEDTDLFKEYQELFLKKEPDYFFTVIEDYIIDLKSKNLTSYIKEAEEETKHFTQSYVDSKLIAEKEYISFEQIDADILEFEQMGISYPEDLLKTRHERFLELNRVIINGIYGY